jgi:hypothetical protein
MPLIAKSSWLLARRYSNAPADETNCDKNA